MRRIRRTIKGIAKIIHEIVTRTISWFGSVSLTEAIANELNYVKVFGECEFAGTEQCNLPSGYTQVEYIESNGTQYIDTGVAPNTNTKIKIGYTLNGITSASVMPYGSRLSGSASDAMNGLFRTHGTNTNRIAFGDGSGTNITITGYNDAGTYYDTTLSKDGYYVNGTLVTNIPTTTITNTYPIYLFAVNSSGTSGFLTPMKLTYCELYDDNVLVRNFIPAKNSNNEVGLYDTVTGTFFTNDGTGTFTAGADAVPTPEAPMNIRCNNGVIKVDNQGHIYYDWATETITDSLWNTATAEMLLWIPWLSDSQEILSGDITRNLGLKVLTSADVSSYQSDNRRFVLSVWASADYGVRRTPLYCTHFETIDDGRALSRVPDGSIYGALSSYLYVHYSSYTTKETFWAWLDAQCEAWTPVMVVYPLQTPITESVAWQTLNIREWTNTLTITQAWIDTSKLELEVQYEALEIH